VNGCDSLHENVFGGMYCRSYQEVGFEAERRHSGVMYHNEGALGGGYAKDGRRRMNT